MNLLLYKRAMHFIDLPYPKVRLTDTTADGYFYRILEDNDVDIVINIDEDAFIFDMNRLLELLDYVVQNQYINCGMPDGGVVHLRRMNPLVTNAYFNILNVSEIRKIFSIKAVQDFPIHEAHYMDRFPKDMLRGDYKFVNYEAYYPFFIWLSQHFKTLYLNAENHPDGESTVLHDHLNRPFLTHTWYSRLYNIDPVHTHRIDKVIAECGQLSGHCYTPSFGDAAKGRLLLGINMLKQALSKIKKRLIP
jgi:hypothetical protein